MQRLMLLSLLLILMEPLNAAYPVSEIPEALMKQSDLVKRLDETKVEVRSTSRAIYYRHYVYTILNEAAEARSGFYVAYDKFRSVVDISGALYNAEGKKIRSVKRKDISDGSANHGNDLAIDDRYKYHNFYYKEYPYTIEYEVTLEMKGIFAFPEWMPQDGPNVAIEKSRFVFEVPKGYGLRYKMFHYSQTPFIKEAKSTTEYSWEISTVASRQTEAYAPEWNQLVTRVVVAPTNFEIGGYKGNMESWQGFGKFVGQLYAGRDILPATVKAKVQELIRGVSTDRQKIDILYRYLQKQTRYISIQLGMGGWQPLDAQFVADKKFGDCKALSNYMVALLKEAGIKAYPALITGGYEDYDLITDFPSNQFNHVIVLVPGAQDSTWLECTSQTVAPGYMGRFTGNRYALVVDGDNSQLAKTPAYTREQNYRNRQVSGTVDAAGVLTATIRSFQGGMMQDELHHVLHDLSPDEKKKRLQSWLPLANYEVRSFEYREMTTRPVPVVEEKLELESKDYADITGKRFFINPNIFSGQTRKPSHEAERNQEIVMEYGFRETDTAILKIPNGYRIETLPKPILLQTEFGSYALKVSFQSDQITLERSLEMNAGKFPASAYQRLKTFKENIFSADQSKLVLLKP